MFNNHTVVAVLKLLKTVTTVTTVTLAVLLRRSLYIIPVQPLPDHHPGTLRIQSMLHPDGKQLLSRKHIG